MKVKHNKKQNLSFTSLQAPSFCPFQHRPTEAAVNAVGIQVTPPPPFFYQALTASDNLNVHKILFEEGRFPQRMTVSTQPAPHVVQVTKDEVFLLSERQTLNRTKNKDRNRVF